MTTNRNEKYFAKFRKFSNFLYKLHGRSFSAGAGNVILIVNMTLR